MGDTVRMDDGRIGTLNEVYEGGMGWVSFGSECGNAVAIGTLEVVETKEELAASKLIPFRPSHDTVLVDAFNQMVREAYCPGNCSTECGSWLRPIDNPPNGASYLEMSDVLQTRTGSSPIDLDPQEPQETNYDEDVDFPLCWEVDLKEVPHLPLRKPPHVHLCNTEGDAPCHYGVVPDSLSKCSCCGEHAHSGEPLYGMLKLGPEERLSTQRFVRPDGDGPGKHHE